MDNKVELLIKNGSIWQEPALEGDITWETERKGAPGKLTFNIVKDSNINFQEGNTVQLRVNGSNVFLGYVFTKKRSKTGIIAVTAYDQLRYFKNKDTKTYKNKTAAELIKMLADDLNINCGVLEDTFFKIAQRIEEDKTFFDMVLNALDITLRSAKRLYVLYDDFGALTLKNIESMKINTLVDSEAAEDFDYTTSIDNNTYNKIKIYRDNEKSGKREIYIAQHGANINKWGILQMYEKVEDGENGKAKADALLSLYNRKSRELSIKKAFGDIRVRGGSSVPVTLDLGDIVANTYMVVDKVKHTINADEHYMDLTLTGGSTWI